MGVSSSQRFLAVYSGLLTFAFAATVLFGSSAPPRDATFDAITVRRLNIVEPDGTLNTWQPMSWRSRHSRRAGSAPHAW